MIAGINEDEVKRIEREAKNSARRLTVDYLFYIFSDKEDVTSYKKEILRKASMRGQKKPELLPEDMAKITAKLLEDCSGETNQGDFTAKIALAAAGWDIFGKEYNFSELENLPIQEKEKVFVEYKDRRKEAEIILDSLLEYNILEKKGARINARGTLKEIIEGRYKEEKHTAHDYIEELKNQILEQDEKKKNSLEKKVKEEMRISDYSSKSEDMPKNQKVSRIEKEINKDSRVSLRAALAVLFSLAILAAYSERASLKQTFYYLKNKANISMNYIAKKLFYDELEPAKKDYNSIDKNTEQLLKKADNYIKDKKAGKKVEK